MIDYVIYGFAFLGFLITLRYLVFPLVYLSLCAIGYTRFRVQFHAGTFKKAGIKKTLTHVMWIWPLQGLQNSNCTCVTMNSLKWTPPFKIENLNNRKMSND